MRYYLLPVMMACLMVGNLNADTTNSSTRAFDIMPGTVALEFYNKNHFSHVQLVHDTVMGGRSDGSLAMVSEPAGLRFFGNLSLANNGGFASVEFRLTQALPRQPFNSIALNVAADGRMYQLRLKTPYIPQGVAYVANFKSDIGQQRYSFQTDAFSGRFRGRAVTNLPNLNLSDVSHISLMLADEQNGPYSIVLYSLSLTAMKSI